MHRLDAGHALASADHTQCACGASSCVLASIKVSGLLGVKLPRPSADAERAELAGVWVAREVDCLETPNFVEAKAVAVGDLHHDCVAVGGLPALAAGCADALDLIVGVIEQRQEFLACLRPLAGASVVLLDVSSGVPVEEDLGRVRPEVAWRRDRHVGRSHRPRPLSAPAGRPSAAAVPQLNSTFVATVVGVEDRASVVDSSDAIRRHT